MRPNAVCLTVAKTGAAQAKGASGACVYFIQAIHNAGNAGLRLLGGQGRAAAREDIDGLQVCLVSTVHCRSGCCRRRLANLV